MNDASTGARPRMRMRLAGILGEAARNLATGTSHACAMALTLACVILLCVGADLMSITVIQRQTDDFVASGGSTTVIAAAGHINGAACDRLGSLDGVIAAGATRGTGTKLTFAVLPSIGVPVHEATPGAIGIFANSTTTARDAVRGNGNVAAFGRSDGNGGVWLSSEAASPIGARNGAHVALRDNRTMDVAGVFDWPNDGRSGGYAYAAIAPVPAEENAMFDQCWVKSWPVPDNIDSLLRLVAISGASSTTERPTVSQLNTSHGLAFDAATAFRSRITSWTPLVAGLTALLLGALAIWTRRLELASALHCGVPKTALTLQVLIETCAWALASAILCAPSLAWMWLENTDDDVIVLTDTLLRVPTAAYVGAMAGTLLCVLFIRERSLFRYFKNR